MLPTQKLSRSRTRTRRAHHARRPATLSTCPQCNKAKLPHAACDNCGFVRKGLALKTKKES